MSTGESRPTEESSEHTDDQPELTGEYDPDETEPYWQERWVSEGTYAYGGDSSIDPNTLYSIDTPPPTVSGNLHIGHLYSHTLQDFAARFHRMHDGETFFPFGYDDNGIASERLTEAELGIDHSDYTRREFQEKCRGVCQEYEGSFTDEMQSLAMSIDWTHTYKTIEPRVQRISQLSFIDLYDKGREYRRKAPAIWCPDCETAISQVEMEGAERDSRENDIAFELVEAGGEPAPDAPDESGGYPLAREPGDDLVITTTRPELLPACVAMFVHPEDDARGHLVGGTARVPLFGHEVPILADERVDRDTGTGLVMCCTFGDQTDIEWYQAHDLPLRVAIDESGTLTDLADEYAGLSTTEARERIIADLDEAGVLLETEPITHTVQVHERCAEDIEFRVSKQWYVKLLDKKEEYLEAGRQMDWYPEKMFTRYKHWIEGLEWDWAISRQRDSGIPFPVWYCEACDEEILADREQLPVDPLADDPPVESCPACGHEELKPESDVFDTWATSSLTPLVNAGWDWDASQDAFTFDHPELYPFDLRPQGHDIISFWLFHTIVKCVEHTGEVPFESVLINGMVLDENREAMSKSKGNVIEPAVVMDEYPVDAIRYWCASAAVGDDFPFKDNELTQGEKLLQKLWNASKLVDSLADPNPSEPAEFAPIDRWILAKLDETIRDVTDQLAAHEYSKARDRLRSFFWHTFCDDYLEIAKQRLREEADASTAYALRRAHRTFLKLFAPLLPHVTEEIWTTLYADSAVDDSAVGDSAADDSAADDSAADDSATDRTATSNGAAANGSGGAASDADEPAGEGDRPASLHRMDWPTPSGYEADLTAGETALAVIAALRRYKTDSGLPLNADLDRVTVFGDVTGFESAIAETMHVSDLQVRKDAPEIETRVTGVDLDYSLVGPEFGEQVGDIEAAIAQGEFEQTDGRLQVAGVELAPEMFEMERERAYQGDGELIETEEAAIVVG